MVKTNNTILFLSVILLIISLAGTFLMLEKTSFNLPGEGPEPVQQGKVELTILPAPAGVSSTGMIGVAILPSKTPENK